MDKPAKSAVERYEFMTVLKHEYGYMRQHTTHHADCGCVTEAADAAIAELKAERDAFFYNLTHDMSEYSDEWHAVCQWIRRDYHHLAKEYGID